MCARSGRVAVYAAQRRDGCVLVASGARLNSALYAPRTTSCGENAFKSFAIPVPHQNLLNWLCTAHTPRSIVFGVRDKFYFITRFEVFRVLSNVSLRFFQATVDFHFAFRISLRPTNKCAGHFNNGQ